MKRAALLPSILLATSIFLGPAAQGAGMIFIDPITGPGMPLPILPHPPVIHPPIHPIHPTPRPTHPVLHGSVSMGLRLEAADIKVEIHDNVAKTYVSQTFANDTDRNVAGTYLFPLPADTTFSSFSLMIDGKPVEGKVLEANEARMEYENIVRRTIDPGLLEYADYKTVRARIFPIPAHGTKKVELEYTQLLSAENGMIKYRFPLRTQGAQEADELKVSVKLNSKQALRTIWSPSHKITTQRTDDHIAKVQFDAKNAAPDKDFFLYYSLSDKDISANVITNKNSGEDGYYLLSLSPPVEAKQVAAKDIVLVTDTSGSMEGERLQQSKAALKYLVNALRPEDRFSLVKFDTDVDNFQGNLVQATPENKKKALSFIDDLEARGGTNMGDALKSAITMLDAAPTTDRSRPAFIVLATDGEPTVGETGVSGLLKLANSKRDVRVFDFGVGYDVNTRLLDKLAEDHHGTAQYIEPSESFETALSNFYNKIQKPVLTDVKITYDGVAVHDTYPREVKDIFAGSQVLLLGRYKVGGAATVKISGNINGVQKNYAFPVKFAASEADNTYLPRMWAMRRIAHLTDVAKENGDSKEVVDEIISLSKKYGIISAYTSFLAVDPNENARLRAMGFGGGGTWRGFAGGAGGGMPMMAPAPMPMMHAGRMMRGSVAMKPMALPAASLDSFVRDSNIVATAPAAAIYGDSGVEHYAHFTGAPQAESSMGAVKKAKVMHALAQAQIAETADQKDGIKTIDDKTFHLSDGYWIDTAYSAKSSPKPVEITFGTKEYFDLLKTPGISKYLAVGRQVIFVFDGKTYKISYKETV